MEQQAKSSEPAASIVRLREVSKTYQRGGEAVRVLAGLDLRRAGRLVRGADGSLGLRQDRRS